MLKKITLLFIILGTSTLYSQENWELQKESNGIRIYTRAVNDSKFKEYKAMTNIQTTLEPVLAELLEAPKYSEHNTPGESYYVSTLGANQHVFYAQKKLPWPLKNRDVVTLLTVEYLSEKKIKLHLESLPDGIPLDKNSIRIKELMGFWLLEQNGNKVTVTQQLHLNPEGSLPASIVNSLLVKGPLKTFTKLQEMGQ